MILTRAAWPVSWIGLAAPWWLMQPLCAAAVQIADCFAVWPLGAKSAWWMLVRARHVSSSRPRLHLSYTFSIVFSILFNKSLVWGECSWSREVASLSNLWNKGCAIFTPAGWGQLSTTHLWFTLQWKHGTFIPLYFYTGIICRHKIFTFCSQRRQSLKKKTPWWCTCYIVSKGFCKSVEGS